MKILKESRRQAYGKAIENLKEYDVIFQVEVTDSLQNTKWEKVSPHIIELHSDQLEGFSWQFETAFLQRNSLDSLDQLNRIFRSTKWDDGTQHLRYVSKPQKILQKNKNRSSYARRPGFSCAIRNYE